MNDHYYHIVYPGGRSSGKLAVVQISFSYEIGDYALASNFNVDSANKDLLIAYAKLLAEKNGLIWDGADDDHTLD